ncbi:MAG: acetoacetate--CoA ligase [Gemmatimonadetes bacterium]|nr:MAG: acetoacetate--CoA ligase [Gemmatimonadota bacterium]
MRERQEVQEVPRRRGVAPLWIPAPERVARANLTAFIEYVHHHRRDVSDHRSLYGWSVDSPDEFWPAIWRFCGVIAQERSGGDPWDAVGVGLDRMAPPDPLRGPRWFPGARLNFAENLLCHGGEHPALISWNESGRQRELSYAQLRTEVARVAAALHGHGVRAGDRVAAFMPNIPETVIAMLAAASLGAIWSSCSPDFGVGGAVDRFGQIAPRVLFTVDGYRYAGKAIDCLERVAALVDRIPAIERVVVVPYLAERPRLASVRGVALWGAWIAAASSPDPVLSFSHLPFDAPLYVLYSSGTTGLPKCMVHGAGGTLLQHLKEHTLHVDLKGEDRFFYFTTCGWMMWNWLASGLATGATVVLYDGAPFSPAPGVLWDMAEAEHVSVFGASAKYFALAEKEGLAPAKTHDLSALRTVLSTGSPLGGHSYDYVYRAIKADVHLANISGGTEIISCFAIGDPTLPVWRGELQTRGLGMAVEVFDRDGAPLRQGAGELVCIKPFPSMPVAFWNDPGALKYRAAYFERFPGAWRHGDWAEFTEHGGLVIHGRSDATLNPGGVRIGTAEIYRQVDALPEILESLAIGQRIADDERIVLFVRLRPGFTLDEALRERIRGCLRERASPRHVPSKIVAVADIPRTISGKISELAVRAVVHGLEVENRDALANPQALDLYRDLPELAP